MNDDVLAINTILRPHCTVEEQRDSDQIIVDLMQDLIDTKEQQKKDIIERYNLEIEGLKHKLNAAGHVIDSLEKEHLDMLDISFKLNEKLTIAEGERNDLQNELDDVYRNISQGMYS